MLMIAGFLLALLLIIIIKIKFLIHTDCKSKVCLVGKTALVTGGNSGIGYQIVLGLLQRGCRVIIADVVKDENLFENIFKETQSRNVVFEYVDLSSFKSTRELTNNIRKKEEKLDILINNAGLGSDISKTTDDGLDLVLQVNYFSAFLLTHLLVDLVKKAKGRIIFTGSLLSHLHDFSMEKLRPEGAGSRTYPYHYHNSKLCLIIAADMLAEKLKKCEVTSNCYHPGLVRTSIFQKSLHSEIKFSFLKFTVLTLRFWAWLGGNTPEEASQTAIYLACANEAQNMTGKFVFECKPTFKPLFAQNKRDCEAVWKISEELVNLTMEERL